MSSALSALRTLVLCVDLTGFCLVPPSALQLEFTFPTYKPRVLYRFVARAENAMGFSAASPQPLEYTTPDV